MKKIFKILGITFIVLLIITGAAAAFIYFRGIPSYSTTGIKYHCNSTPESVARGRKLAVMLCANCHLNNATGKLTGRHMSDAPPEFGYAYSANITQDKSHGIGNYSDAELVWLLRTGIKRNGKYAPPYMAKLPHLSDYDLNAIISFLRSDDALVQADPTPAKPCEPSFLTKFLCVVAFKPLPYPEKPISMPDTTNPVMLGKYLVHNLDCYTCHSGDFTKLDILNPENSFGYLGGGNKPLDQQGNVVLTANITPDAETGIGTWTEEKFVRALRFGLIEGQPALRYPMMPYTQLTDYEAACIFRYLKTVPAIKNKIDRPS